MKTGSLMNIKAVTQSIQGEKNRIYNNVTDDVPI